MLSVGVAVSEPPGALARHPWPAAPDPRRARAVPGPSRAAPPPSTAGAPPPPAAVLDAVYDAALEPERWPDALAALAAALGGSAATLHAGPAAGPPRIVAASGVDEAALRDHEGRHGASDPLGDAAAREAAWAAPLAARDGACCRGGGDAESSAFFAGWMRPNGFGDALCLALSPPGATHQAGVRVLRPARAPRFGPADAAVLARLAPHLRRAAELNRRLSRAGRPTPAAEALAEAFNRFAAGVLLLDAGGAVAWANRAAEATLRNGDGLSLGRGGALRAAAPGANDGLRRLLGAAAAGAEGAMPVPRAGGGAALALHAVPLPAAAAAGAPPSRPNVLLLLSDPAGDDGAGDAALRGRLRAVYGLTAAEAAVAAGAARGVGLPEVARSLGLAVATARTHAQRVFGKAGVRGQAELARQVERLSLLIAAPEAAR